MQWRHGPPAALVVGPRSALLSPEPAGLSAGTAPWAGASCSMASCPPAVPPPCWELPQCTCELSERRPACRCFPSFYLLLSHGPNLATGQSYSTKWSQVSLLIPKTCKYCHYFAIFDTHSISRLTSFQFIPWVALQLSISLLWEMPWNKLLSPPIGPLRQLSSGPPLNHAHCWARRHPSNLFKVEIVFRPPKCHPYAWIKAHVLTVAHQALCGLVPNLTSAWPRTMSKHTAKSRGQGPRDLASSERFSPERNSGLRSEQSVRGDWNQGGKKTSVYVICDFTFICPICYLCKAVSHLFFSLSNSWQLTKWPA